MKNIICKIFDHKWIYSKTVIGTTRYYRNCKRCGAIAEYRENVHAYGRGWFHLVQFTKKGAKDLLTELDKGRIYEN